MSPLASELFLSGFDADVSEPRYRQLFRALQQAILQGRLTPGSRLPASRELAQTLDISRNTVKTAYEMLLSEGYIETRQGSGSFVSLQLPETEPVAAAVPVQKPGPAGKLSALAQRLPERKLSVPGLLAPAQPCSGSFPWDQWQRAVGRAARQMKHGAATDALGSELLRREIAGYLQRVRGVRCDAGQVLICSGAQQALYLALLLLVDPGEAVLVEQPGYPGIGGAIAAVGASPVPVMADTDGFRLQDGLARAPQARLALLTPSRNYPMGYTLSLQRRLALLDWATASGSWLIEDDYDSEFRFDGPPLTSLQGLGGEGQVLYAGTFSRILHPSIRLGYLVVPESLVGLFRNARQYLDGGLSLLPQRALGEFMAAGHFASHVRRMRRLYRQRRDCLNQLVAERFGGSLQLVASDGGMHSVFLLPDGRSDVALCRRLQSRGLGIRPLSAYYNGQGAKQGLVIGFAGYPEEDIERGIDVLQREWLGLR